MSEYHYRWEWRLRSSPERLWPLVADTNRFNRDAGVPALELEEVRRGGRRVLRLSKLGIPIEWEEEPFEWIEPYRFSVVRRYSKGPLEEMRVAVELTAEAGGTLLIYEVWASPRNALGRISIPIEVGRRNRARFERAFRHYDELLMGEASPDPQARLAPGGERRLEAGRETLLGQGSAPDLVDRLVGVLARADDLTVARLRPYALADAWGAERRDVLELFLHATRAGLVEFRWDLLCPLCRGPQQRTGTLREVDPHQHCDSCAIDFRIDFEHSVELTFRPAPAIREVVEREFCVGGPQVTPHVLAQQLVPPGGERTFEPELAPGRYRLRTREAKTEELLVVASGERPTVRLSNESAHDELFVLERIAWSDQAVCAAEVTALQVFRDLFAQEALRPDEPISVGTLAVLFTDLRDSTRFYIEVGDAPAFGSVMNHLDVLRDAVADEGGAVVKAMGDAIMAVFGRPVAAVRAAQRAQRALAAPANGTRPFVLKVGIHAGHCIAVTQNARLDYFGSTVNLAARLVDLSSGRDVIVSSEVARDPEVADLLASELNAKPIEATLKGFEDERFEIWAIG